MKIVKPMAVSFSFRTFLLLQKQQLCVTNMIGFVLGAGARRLVPDIALWPRVAEATGRAVDEGLPKARGEVLVHGSCHAPGGVPVSVAMVRVRVAPPSTLQTGRGPSGLRGEASPLPRLPHVVDKQLAVFGDRYWEGSATRGPSNESVPLSYRPSEPTPFHEMPLGWERAFGGELFPDNPLGRGLTRVPFGEGIQRLPLPNVELASNLITSSLHRPAPASLGPVDVSWPQRQSRAGSYSGPWLEEDFPGFARDLDPAFFSTAQEDQRIAGFFRGDEEYLLENMHPTQPCVSGRLPGVAARVLIGRKGSTGVEDVAMRLDTIVFLPTQETGILVFRGLLDVREDDASDIRVALAACEELDAPRVTEHYVAALEHRLDKDESPMAALNEDDLLPSFAAGSGIAEVLGKPEDSSKEYRERIRERTLARVRQQLADAGVPDPDAALAEATKPDPLLARLERLPDPADAQDLAEYVAALEAFDVFAKEKEEDALKIAQGELETLESTVRRDIEALGPGPDPETLRAREQTLATIQRGRRALAGQPEPEDAPPTGDGPPKPQTPAFVKALTDAGIEPDVNYVAKLQEVDGLALESYRSAAHYAPAARHLDAGARERARAEVTSRVSSPVAPPGTSKASPQKHFEAEDWTRYDLSALDFAEANLRNVLLEGADLSDANFARADVSGGVLAHALVRRTCFDGSTLEGTNFGGSRVDGATFVGANLRNAIFARSKLEAASLRDANLTEVDWLETEFGAVDFEGATAEGTNLLPKIDAASKDAPPTPMDLMRCRFPRAKLRKSSVFFAQLDGVDFTEADLDLVTFLSVRADGASFRGASLRKLHAVMGCSFAGASFDGADLTDAFLRGSSLRGASFEGARLDGADLSECDLTGATLSHAQASRALFIGSDLTGASFSGSNLMDAMLQKAKLYGADLARANLFAANLGLVRLDGQSNVRGANLKRALMLPKAKAP